MVELRWELSNDWEPVIEDNETGGILYRVSEIVEILQELGCNKSTEKITEWVIGAEVQEICEMLNKLNGDN